MKLNIEKIFKEFEWEVDMLYTGWEGYVYKGVAGNNVNIILERDDITDFYNGKINVTYKIKVNNNIEIGTSEESKKLWMLVHDKNVKDQELIKRDKISKFMRKYGIKEEL